MKNLFLIAFIFLSNILYSQSNKEKLLEIEKKMEVAIQNEDYATAEELKKEKNIRIQIEEAIEKGDFKKAGELQKEINSETKTESNREAVKEKKKNVKQNYKYINYNLIHNPEANKEFPPMRLCDDGEYVIPIGIINGIEVGYYLESDFDVDIDGYSDTYYDITLVYRNLTGKEIYYDSPLDLVGEVKFTGEEVEIYLSDYTIEKLGGRCPIYAENLDNEEGRYVMYPDDDYYAEFSISQDSEGWLELIWLRRLKPLWLSTYIPKEEYKENNITDFRFFPDLNLDKSEIERVGNYITRKVKLPNKKIECTFAERGLKLETPLQKQDNFNIAFENDRIRISYFIDKSKDNFKKSSGYIQYPITFKIDNKSNLPIVPYKLKHDRYLGYLSFQNSFRIPIQCVKKNGYGDFESVTLPAGGSIEYTDKLNVTLYSGELFVGSTISKRNIESTRDIIPEQIIIKTELLESKVTSMGKTSDDGSTKIKFFIVKGTKSDLTGDTDPMYLNMYNQNMYYQYIGMNDEKYIKANVNTLTEFTLSREGALDVFIARDKPTSVKKMKKKKQGKLAVGVYHGAVEVKKGWTAYVLYTFGQGVKVVDEETFLKYVNKFNPKVIKSDF